MMDEFVKAYQQRHSGQTSAVPSAQNTSVQTTGSTGRATSGASSGTGRSGLPAPVSPFSSGLPKPGEASTGLRTSGGRQITLGSSQPEKKTEETDPFLSAYLERQARAPKAAEPEEDPFVTAYQQRQAYGTERMAAARQISQNISAIRTLNSMPTPEQKWASGIGQWDRQGNYSLTSTYGQIREMITGLSDEMDQTTNEYQRRRLQRQIDFYNNVLESGMANATVQVADLEPRVQQQETRLRELENRVQLARLQKQDAENSWAFGYSGPDVQQRWQEAEDTLAELEPELKALREQYNQTRGMISWLEQYGQERDEWRERGDTWEGLYNQLQSGYGRRMELEQQIAEASETMRLEEQTANYGGMDWIPSDKYLQAQQQAQAARAELNAMEDDQEEYSRLMNLLTTGYGSQIATDEQRQAMLEYLRPMLESTANETRRDAVNTKVSEAASTWITPFLFGSGVLDEAAHNARADWEDSSRRYLELQEQVRGMGEFASSPEQVAGTIVRNGLDQFSGAFAGFVKMIDDVAGIDPDNQKWALMGRWANEMLREKNYANQQMAQIMTNAGSNAQLASQLGVSTIAAIPNAVMAMFTGGGSLTMTTEGLMANAANVTGALTTMETVSAAMKSMATNPIYWNSFVTATGDGYISALESGADQDKAVIFATINGLLNAAIEVGGGVETLPGSWNNETVGSAIQKMINSGFEEGMEEVKQGIVERGLQNLILGADNPLVSFTDTDAIFSLAGAMQEFYGGFVVGELLGGVQSIKTIKTAAEARAAAKQINAWVVENLPEGYRPDLLPLGVAAPDIVQRYAAEVALCEINYISAMAEANGELNVQQAPLTAIEGMFSAETMSNSDIEKILTDRELRAQFEEETGRQLPTEKSAAREIVREEQARWKAEQETRQQSQQQNRGQAMADGTAPQTGINIRNDANSAENAIRILQERGVEVARYGGVEYNVVQKADDTFTARAMQGDTVLWSQEGLKTRTAAVNALLEAQKGGQITVQEGNTYGTYGDSQYQRASDNGAGRQGRGRLDAGRQTDGRNPNAAVRADLAHDQGSLSTGDITFEHEYTPSTDDKEALNAVRGIRELGATSVHIFTGTATRGGAAANITGYIDPEGNVYLRGDAADTTLREVGLHEYYHLAVQKDPQIREQAMQILRESYTDEQLRDLINHYGSVYNRLYGQYDAQGNLTNEAEVNEKIIEEICADAFSGRADGFRSGVEQATGDIRTMVMDAVRSVLREAGVIQDAATAVNENAPAQAEAGSFAAEGNAGTEITLDSTDEQRYEILKDRQMTAADVDYDKLDDPNYQKLGDLDTLRLEGHQLTGTQKSDAKKALRNLARMLRINSINLSNCALQFDFRFSNNNVEESASQQNRYSGTFQDLAKALSCLPDLVNNAVLIETHKDEYDGTEKANPDLKQAYVLVSIMRDGDRIVPVKMLVKEFYSVDAGLYMTVALSEIEKSEPIRKASAGRSAATQSLNSDSVYSLLQIIRNVKPKDGRLLKYFPDQMLSTEQIEGKKRAGQDSEEKKVIKIDGQGRFSIEEDVSSNVGTENRDAQMGELFGVPEDAEIVDPGDFSRMPRAEAKAYAEENNYPMLQRANGKEEQAVPGWTWVRANDRGNYGRVIGKGVTDSGENGLEVVFWNKAESRRQGHDVAFMKTMAPSELTLVDPQLSGRNVPVGEAPAEMEAYYDTLTDEEYDAMFYSREDMHQLPETATGEEQSDEEWLSSAQEEYRRRMEERGQQLPNRDGRIPEGMTAEELDARDRHRRMLERERGARPQQREDYQGTEAMRELGIQIDGSVASDVSVERLQQSARAIKEADRRVQQLLRKYHPDSRTQAYAHEIASGNMTDADIPGDVDTRVVMDLASAYMTRENARLGSFSNVRREINDRNYEYAKRHFSDSEKYNPAMFRNGFLQKFAKVIMNERTPERVVRAIFGDEHGAKVYRDYFAPVFRNEGRKTLWINQQLDDVRNFTDSKGETRGLNKTESELTQQVVEGRAFEEAAGRLEGYDKQIFDAHVHAFQDYQRALQMQGGQEAAEQADAILRGERTKAEALQQPGVREDILNLMLQIRGTMTQTSAGDADLQKTIDGYEWYQQVRQRIDALDDADATIIDNAADAYRAKYDLMYQAINQFLVQHGYEEIGFIRGYAPHMQEEQSQTALQKALGLMGIQMDEAMKLPAGIAGRTADFKPNFRYNPHFQSRKGSRTEYNIQRGFQDYVKYMADVFYHTDDIMRLRQAVNYYRTAYGDAEISANLEAANAIKTASLEQKISFLNGLPGESGYVPGMSASQVNELIDSYVEEQYAANENLTKYSEFVTWLDNYANILAGKQSLADRGLEYTGGRQMLNWSNKLMNLFRQANVAGNFSSALNQTAQMPLITAHLGPKYTIAAMRDILSGSLKKTGWTLQSDYLNSKEGVRLLEMDPGAVFLKKMFTLTEAMDGVLSKLAVRGEYLRQLDNGVSEDVAMRRADEYGKQVMGSRAKGSKPQGFESKRFTSQMLHVFQVEAMNTFDYIVSDLPAEFRNEAEQNGKAAAAKKLGAAMLAYLLQAFAMNRLSEEVYGGSPVPYDAIGLVFEGLAGGNDVTTNRYLAITMDNALENLFGERILGTDRSELSDEFNWKDARDDVLYAISNDLPYVRNIAGMAGLGDQTLPTVGINQIIKGVQSIGSGLRGEDDKLGGGDANWREVGEGALNIAAQMRPRGRQLKKTIQGLDTVIEGGTYTGNGEDRRLKYAVDNGWSNWPKYLQAALFGRNALSEQDAYYAGDMKALTANQTAVHTMLVSEGMGREEAYDILQEYRSIMNNKDLSALERGIQSRALISSLPVDDEAKLEAYLDLVLNGEQTSRYEKFRTMMDAGMQWGDIMEVYDEYCRIDDRDDLTASQKALEFSHWVDGYTKSEKRQNIILDNLKFWSMAPAQATGYERLVETGLSPDAAYRMQSIISGLEPEEGRLSVSDNQRLQAIADSNLSDADKIAAFGAILGSDEYTESGNRSAYGKFLDCLAAGATVEQYMAIRELGKVDNFLKYAETGIDPDMAVETLEVVGDLPQGASALSQYQEVAGSVRSEEDKEAMMQVLMSGKQYTQYMSARNAGISTYAYVGYLTVLDEVDENNSISRADVYEALSRCNFSYQERVAIWNGYIEAGNWKSSYDSFRP